MIYLDWNIYVGMIDGRYSELEISLMRQRDRNGYLIPYSSEIVEESCAIRSEREIQERLQFLTKITDDIYFENSVTDHQIINRSPGEVRKTLGSSWPNKVMKWISLRLIPYALSKFIRRGFNINTIKLNNMAPDTAIEYINECVRNSEYTERMPEEMLQSPLRYILQEVTNITARNNTSYKLLGGSPDRGRAPDVQAALLYSLLESFGYWADDKKTYEKGSRFADQGHCYYCLLSSLAISNDKRFRKKVEAVAYLTRSPVLVLSPEEALRFFAENG